MCCLLKSLLLDTLVAAVLIPGLGPTSLFIQALTLYGPPSNPPQPKNRRTAARFSRCALPPPSKLEADGNCLPVGESRLEICWPPRLFNHLTSPLLDTSNNRT